ncbi:MAG: UDP-N-acetylmuramoyl-L-alanyl-D-glutamate--2,6-diaminopimelate ligase [Candidatus Bipolaricaulia bacterium]
MRLEALLRALEHWAISGEPRPESEIREIVCDSRSVRPGSLFVAIPGSKHDGHDYIPQAVARGASAIVGERELVLEGATYIRVPNSRRALAELAAAFYGHPTRKLYTVGITGTKGKTTVAHLAQSILGLEETELLSTVSNNLQRGLVNTTPDPLTIQRLASEALKSGKKGLVLEVSAHALSQERVLRVEFAAAVFTNLSHDHLDYYRTLDDYFEAKRRLFTMLKPTATAIINSDDPYSQRIAHSHSSRAQLLTYGLFSGEIRPEEVRLGLEGSRLLVRTPSGQLELETALPGRFNVYNILAAVGVGLARGLDLRRIKEGIEAVRAISGRFERFSTRAGFDVVIDFAHSPDALYQVLSALRPYYRRIIAVFGCGGESDRAKRPVMGQISGSLSDYTILTSDNPKSEEPGAIIAEIEAGLKETAAPYEAIVDRREAIRRAIELARRGDVILIAGKGHERTQIFADHEEEFNDLDFLREEGLIQ